MACHGNAATFIQGRTLIHSFTASKLWLWKLTTAVMSTAIAKFLRLQKENHP